MGWHGAQPWGLKGVDYDPPAHNFQHVDSEGISRALAENIIVVPYNDPARLEEIFKKRGDSIACFILEPFIGAGGFIPASPEYLKTARKLTEQYGALLIFDEIISGFRFRAGSAARFYGVQPDLSTFGKICGGGMPVSAVAGRKEVLDLCGKEACTSAVQGPPLGVSKKSFEFCIPTCTCPLTCKNSGVTIVFVKQQYQLPCINRYREVIVSLIKKPIMLAGSKGRSRVTALFDSGASYSCINKKLAEELAHLEPLSEPMEFETAEKDSTVIAEYRITVDFFFTDSDRRFTDELVVIEGLSEELIIGAKTMQAWKIRLDFDREDVIYDKKMHRLRI